MVVLIDEYDAPLLDVIHEDRDLPKLRNIMCNFYSPLKACDPYLRFVFMTGITKFSQLSIFSELNNIQNISMLPAYAAICGITEEEMLTQLTEGIDALAEQMNATREDAIGDLKRNYDGYHFSEISPDIYNPFSLLNAMVNGSIKPYWFGSGTPTYLIEMLRKYNILPSMIGGMRAVATDFDAPTERMTSITPLLYQSGYLTIKSYSPVADLYTLDIPNTEVRVGLMKSLLPNYIGDGQPGNTTVGLMREALYYDDLNGALEILQTFLGTVPYCNNADSEGHWQQLLYIIFSLLGAFADVEVHTPNGRVDMVMCDKKRLYLFELKLNQSAAVAMKQINLKDYAKRFALYNLPIVKVGINFSVETHNITDWKITE